MAARRDVTCTRMNETSGSKTNVQKKLASLAEGDSTQLTSLAPEVQQFLNLHPSMILIGPEKVRCGLTGHEMPCKMEAMESYTKGRRYQHLQEKRTFDWDEHLPHIVPSKKKGHRHQLFCKLTMRHISREPVDVQRHVNGRRYTRALARYNECQREGVPFKPLCRIPRKDRGHGDMDQGVQGPSPKNSTDSENSEGVSEDSMSDLYPAADFEEFEGDGLQNDIENMDIAGDMKGIKEVTSAGLKRKNVTVSKKNTAKRMRKDTLLPTSSKKLKDT